MSILLTLGCALAMLTTAPTASAAPASEPEINLTELSLEELSNLRVATVYGAAKREQNTADAPSAVSILTRDDLQKLGYQTLGEALNGVRGFYVSSDRAYDFVGVRGMNRPGDYGGRILVNIDGHRLNDPIYDATFTSTEFLIDLDLVERIEVIRGPGSSLYGNNAFFTVINVITRSGSSVQGTELAGSYARYDTYSGRATFGRKFNADWELMLSGTWLEGAGPERVYFPEYAGYAEDLDGVTTKSVFAALTYRAVTLQAGAMQRRKPSPAAQYFSAFNDPRQQNEDARAYAELKLTHEFDSGWQLQARSYYDYYNFNAVYPFEVGGPIILNRDREHANWLGGEISLSRPVGTRQRLTFGGEWRQDLKLRLRNYDVTPLTVYVDSKRDTQAYAAFAQDEITLGTNLTLTAGVRYDYFSTFGDTINPRLAVVGTPWSNGTLKLLYGQAFRAPNEYEWRYIQPNYKVNPDLEPESIQSIELVYEQKLTSKWRLTGNIFYNHVDGLIGQTVDPGDGLTYFDNLEHISMRGGELELEGRWEGGWQWRCSYTYTKACEENSDERLDNSPAHLGKAQIIAPLWKDTLFGSIELNAISHRRTVQGNQVGGFYLLNATLLCRDLRPGWDWSVSIHNLLDRRYDEPASTDFLQDTMPQSRRTVRAKLTYRF